MHSHNKRYQAVARQKHTYEGQQRFDIDPDLQGATMHDQRLIEEGANGAADDVLS